MLEIGKTYISKLQDRYVVYANVTRLDTLTHMYTNYMRITPKNLQENYE